ncbi:MAG TPA: tail fiber protein [Roseiflexaceae bacterium]|jgi:microcystin-dependent protein|nr:tail fiber protein [Roseiflexaceae bacterium]
MSEPFLGEIRLFAGNFAPVGWALCQGQLLSISQNTALFSILGTTYGGNGQTTFGLPDLRGRVPLGWGQGPGLPAVNLGEMAGSPTHTMIITEMPAHNHTAQTAINASSSGGNTPNPANNYPAASTTRDNVYTSGASNSTMNTGAAQTTVGVAGGSQPFSIMQPYLGINFIIALEGIYPSRG